MKSLSLFGLLLMIVGAVGLVFTGHLFARVPWAIAVQVVAAALMLWARVTFGARSFHASANPTEGGLVTSGPYHFIRHPIYTAICLIHARRRSRESVVDHGRLLGARGDRLVDSHANRGDAARRHVS